MALLDTKQVENGKVETAKVSNEKQFSYQKRRGDKIRKGAQRICGNKRLFDQLDAEDKAYLSWLAKEPQGGGGGGGSPLITKLFGAEPKVGQSITMQEVFNKTLKGKSHMDGAVKRWAEKGIIVEYVHNNDKPAQSTYTIKKLA